MIADVTRRKIRAQGLEIYPKHDAIHVEYKANGAHLWFKRSELEELIKALSAARDEWDKKPPARTPEVGEIWEHALSGPALITRVDGDRFFYNRASGEQEYSSTGPGFPVYWTFLR